MPAPTRASLYALGLPPPAVARVPQLVESTVDGSGLILVRGHALALDAPLSFRAVSSTTLGATPSSLPVPLDEGVTYAADPQTSDAFRVKLNGTAITAFTAAAVGRFAYVVDAGAALDVAIAKAWTVVQSDCTAHGGDVDAPLLTDAAAALAIRFYVAMIAAGDPAKAKSYDGLAVLYAEIYAPKLAAFFAGAPVRNATDATPSRAENGPVLVQPSRGPFAPLSTSTADRNRV